MSLFTTPTKLVDLGEGNTVTLRSLTYGEVKFLTTAGGDDDRWLLAGILRWDGEGFEGQAPSKETLAKLPVGIVKRLTEEMTGLLDVDAQEKKA